MRRRLRGGTCVYAWVYDSVLAARSSGNLLWNGFLTWSGIRRTTPRPADGSPQTVHADWTTEAPNAPGASAPSRGRHTAGTHGTRGTRERRSPWEAPGTGEGSAP